jgi:hypothetical protein
MPDKIHREKPQNTYKFLHVVAKFWGQLYKVKLEDAKIGGIDAMSEEKIAES